MCGIFYPLWLEAEAVYSCLAFFGPVLREYWPNSLLGELKWKGKEKMVFDVYAFQN